jgi:hypothetical protein
VWADAMKFVWRAPLIVQSEDGGQPAIIVNGRRRVIADAQTFEALRLNPAHVRKLAQIQFEQYPLDEMLPSVMSEWVGVYYNNTLLSPPASVIQADPTLNFRWNGAAPAANMGARDFSVRWSRYFALTEGDYPFRIEAVGGVRLWVDGKLELNEWDAPSSIFIAHDKVVPLTSGLHRVDIEYVNRDGYAQVGFGNIPPNAPIVVDQPVSWTTAPTTTLRWQDAGDADSLGEDKPRRFFATIWHDNGWRASSGWIREMEWTVSLPADGRYQWSVLASDGTANSATTAPREVLVDRSTPWAQMLDATTPQSLTQRLALTATAPIDAYRLITDANGNLVVESVVAVEAMPGGTPVDQLVPRVEAQAQAQAQTQTLPAVGNLPAVYLRWWGKDSPSESSDGLTYEVQVHELVRAHTEYTITVENQEVTRIGYELVLSGSEEITVPVVITEVVPFTTVAPLVSFMPVTDSQWITFATGLTYTETVFIGSPGSTYEFRVRATDVAGNAQQWYEGYSAQAAIDPKTTVYYGFVPWVQR